MSRDSNYDKHVKAEAVSLVVDSEKSIASVSRELDIAKSTVGNWVRDYKDDGIEAFVGSGNLSPFIFGQMFSFDGFSGIMKLRHVISFLY